MSETRKRPALKRKNRTVHDVYGTAYVLTDKIGEGGQGIVCTTDRPTVLVKLLNTKDPELKRHWINRLNWVLSQELDGLHIARPQALIEKPIPGYVLELMDGLEPLQKMLEASHQALLDGGSLSEYVATGGLKRRLALLRELASTLSGLHARGLAFGDLSPANIFISQSVEHHQVWLIDCDNLCATERLGHGHIHTPDYGAPEVVREEQGVNSLTDAWSFAIIVFELLTHRHPFKGTAVLYGEPEEEMRALRGELPWIHHPDDESNTADGGIPLDLVATTRLQGLFEECFNAGLNDPLARPSLAEWADALNAAWALILDCTAEDCRSSFYWNNERQCPFCDQRLADGLLLEHAWFCPEESPDMPYLDTGDRQVLGTGRPVELHLAPVGTRGYRESPLVCTLNLDDAKLHMTPEKPATLTLKRLEDGKSVEFTTTAGLSTARRRGIIWVLHLALPDAPGLHPVWRFVW